MDYVEALPAEPILHEFLALVVPVGVPFLGTGLEPDNTNAFLPVNVGASIVSKPVRAKHGYLVPSRVAIEQFADLVFDHACGASLRLWLEIKINQEQSQRASGGPSLLRVCRFLPDDLGPHIFSGCWGK